MASAATPPYRFGDVLALARQSWVRQMADALSARGYPDYRISDAATLRLLLRSGPVTIGQLGEVLGVTRQAARKVARQLELRGLATAASGTEDARTVIVALTESGRRYSLEIVEVIAALNSALADRVGPAALAAADLVLRAVISPDGDRGAVVGRIAPPGR